MIHCGIYSSRIIQVMELTNWAEIDLSAIYQNVKTLAKIVNVPMMGVIKADAYGFGAVKVAQIETKAGVSAFACARVEEGLLLRKEGITLPILIFAVSQSDEIDAAIKNNLILSINNFDMVDLIEARCECVRTPIEVHLKIDTGMGRFGIFPEEVPAMLEKLKNCPCLHLDGIYSHYALIDDDPDDPFNQLQHERFEKALQSCRDVGCTPRWIHFSNSAAALECPLTRYNLVRIGSAFFGSNPFYYKSFPSYLKRVITWKARLISVRLLPAGYGIGYGQTYHLTQDSWVGAVAAGYGDGFLRNPNNEVLICGMRFPVIGKVCTDVSMIKLPEKFGAGEEVVLLGKQGNESISIEDLASRWAVSRAGVTTGMTSRVKRIYIE